MARLGTLALLIAATAVAAGGAYLLTVDTGDRGPGPGERVVTVQTAAVDYADFADVIEAIGTAQANESVTVTARVSETVQRVNFDDGMLVERGDVLLELTSEEEQAQLAEAQANLREAERQYDRIADLVRRGNASKSSLDAQERQVAETRSRIAAAEARIADRVIAAPFAGILGLRRVSPGTLVEPGTTITTLDDVSLIKLDFSIPERFIAALAPGQQVVGLAAAYPNRDFLGEVRTVDSRVDPITRAVTVRAEIPNPDAAIRPGMLMTVRVISRQRRVLSVPERALVPVAEQQFVFVVDTDNTVRRVQIDIGTRRPGTVEVLSGLAEGDRVVTAGTMRLRPGARVRVMDGDADQGGATGTEVAGS